METVRLSTGISGLDDISNGGLLPGRVYLIRGGAGSGKTTLGYHFLMEGVNQGENALYITLGEDEGQLRDNAKRLKFDLTNITFLDLSPGSDYFAKMESYDLFTSAEIEREPVTQRIIEAIETSKPKRIFLDSVTHFRYLSQDNFQFRKHILSFHRYLKEKNITVLVTSEEIDETSDKDLQFMSDGVINLENNDRDRKVYISKFRGSGFQNGKHSMRLSDNGIKIFPRLIPESYRRHYQADLITSGIGDLDVMLNGGLSRGTITIISGPSGVGKTTVGIQIMKEAASRRERSVIYVFEEDREILLRRCKNINIPARTMIEEGSLNIIRVEPLQYSPDEFAQKLRYEVEEKNTLIVMIDSVAGYSISVKGDDVVTPIHAICKYLQNMGVAVILINETECITGEFKATDEGLSYLADNLIFIRYLEIEGELRKALGILKKRDGDFQKSLRELEITESGIKLGTPMKGLKGILSGIPEWK